MQANAIAASKFVYVCAFLFHDTGHFVSKRQGQGTRARSSFSVMRIGMTNPRCFHANQNVVRSDCRERSLLQFKRSPGPNMTNRLHT